MVVNELSGKEVMIVGFGGVFMLTAVILSSIYVGHAITQSSGQQTIHVAAATPKIEVNVPQGPAPRIEVTAAAPRVDVHVPQNPAPIITVTTPPATVTVLDRRENRLDAERAPVKLPPLVAPVPIPQNQSIPVSAPDTNKASEAPPSIDSLYAQAERYIASYCQKNSLDAGSEKRKWLSKWNDQVETAMRDGTATDEQSYINRVVVDKRDCFDLEKATPEKIVEGCRLMLRYRDANLTWLQAMKTAVTAENLQKTMTFLAAGVK